MPTVDSGDADGLVSVRREQPAVRDLQVSGGVTRSMSESETEPRVPRPHGTAPHRRSDTHTLCPKVPPPSLGRRDENSYKHAPSCKRGHLPSCCRALSERQTAETGPGDHRRLSHAQPPKSLPAQPRPSQAGSAAWARGAGRSPAPRIRAQSPAP